MAAQLPADAPFPLVDLVGARAVTRLPVDAAVFVAGADRKVIVGHQPRQVGNPAFQRDDDRVIAIGLHVGHRRQQRFRRRGAVFTAVVVQRGDHVGGHHRLAAVERRVRVDLEGPDRGILVRRPVARKVRTERAIGLDQGQVAAVLVRQVDLLARNVLAGVVRVRRVAVVHPHLERAALLGLGIRLGGPEAGCSGCGHTRSHGIMHERPARNLPFAGGFGEPINHQLICSLCHIFSQEFFIMSDGPRSCGITVKASLPCHFSGGSNATY